MKTRTLVIVIVLLLGIAVLGSGTKTHAQVGSLAGRTITRKNPSNADQRVIHR